MQGRAPVINNFPRVAFVGREAITASFGSGGPIARHFFDYPQSKLVDLYWRSNNDRLRFPSIEVGSENLGQTFWKSPRRTRLNAHLLGNDRSRCASLLYKSRVFDPIEINWTKFGGAPEIIYSTCSSAEDFAFLHHVYRNLPKKVPIIQHFADVDFSSYNYMLELYFDLLPAIAAVWVDTVPTFYAVSHFSPIKPELVQALYLSLPKVYKTKHKDFSKNFRSVISNFIPSHSGAATLKKVWAECQGKLSYQTSVHLLNKKLKTETLYRRIREADLGVLPFSGRDLTDDPNRRYSLPACLGDFCANGLPVVLISAKETVPRKIVEENELGIVIDPAEESKVTARRLRHFLLDKVWRAECGMKARYYAEKELDIRFYQTKLYNRLSEFSKLTFPRPEEKKQFLGLAFHE